MTTSVSSFTQAVEAVAASRSKQSKPVANNTWCEKRDEDTYAIRLHATDVVTYHRDGRIVLNTGGWLTVTTKERINRFSPFSVYSQKGQWRVSYRKVEKTFEATAWSSESTISVWDSETSIPFADGVTFVNDNPVEGTFPDTRVEEQQARACKEIDKDIKKFKPAIKKAFAKWQAEINDSGGLRTAGDCFYCQGIVQTVEGGVADDNGHLWAHLREQYVPFALVVNAYQHKLNRDRDATVQFLLRHISFGLLQYVEQFTVKYLRDRLYPAGVATAQGRRATPDVTELNTRLHESFVGIANDALQRPSDFGYFGNDETLYSTSAPTFGRNRDSEYIDNANFEIVWEALVEEFPDLVNSEQDRNEENVGGIYVFRAGHWAVGWIEQIVVPVVKDSDRAITVDNLHPAFIRVCEFAESARTYPALPGAEERAAEAEANDEEESIKRDLEYLGAPEGVTVADVRNALSEAGVGYDWYAVQVGEVLAAAAEERAYQEESARNTVAGQTTLL